METLKARGEHGSHRRDLIGRSEQGLWLMSFLIKLLLI